MTGNLTPGDVFAGYTIQAELGRGGMGTVYLASHPRLPRQDALKLLSGHLSTDDKFRTRFEREADLAARLFHRNIVAVHDRGSEGGQLWIAMQYVEGSDTAQALRLAGGQGLDPARVVRIVSEVAAALDFAHRRHMLHRDVKPANILLAPPEEGSDDDETVLLSDFGIAKLVDENQNLTGTGNLLATLAYASPEQIEGKPFDHRVDIYSLGCVLYELLTGSVPFPNENAFATMRAHLSESPPAPSARRPALAVFDSVVAKAMAKDPADRFQSCRALATAAAAALSEMASESGAGRADSVGARPTTVLDLAGGTTLAAGPGGVAGSGQVSASPGPSDATGALLQPGYSEPVTASRPPYVISVLRSGPHDATPSAQLGEVNTTNLPQDDRIALEELIYRVRFFELPDQLAQHQQIPGDIFEQISVATAYQRHTVGYYRGGSPRPAELDRLVGVLERCAAWQQSSWQAAGRAADSGVTALAGQTGAGSFGAGSFGAGSSGAGSFGAESTGAGSTGAGSTGAGSTGGTEIAGGFDSAGPTTARPTSSGLDSAGPTTARPTAAGPTDAGGTGPTELSYPGEDLATRHVQQARPEPLGRPEPQAWPQQHSGPQQTAGHQRPESNSRPEQYGGSNRHSGSNSTQPAPQLPPSGRKKTGLLVGAAAALVVVIAVGVYLLTRDGSSSAGTNTAASASPSVTDQEPTDDQQPGPAGELSPAASAGAAGAAGAYALVEADLDNNVAYLDLEEPGSQGRVQFEAKAGDRAFINVTETTFPDDCEPLTLRSNEDEILGSGCFFSGSGFIDGTYLPYDGEYSIVADPSDNSTGGNLTVELFLSQDQDATVEVDGTPYTADISVPGGRADLTFSGTSGQRVFVSMPGSSFTDDCDILTLRDSNNEILSSGCTSNGVAYIDTTELPADGEYHIVVDPTGTGVGSGDIQVTSTTVTGKSITIDGPAVTANLANPGDTETLTFTATAGQFVFVSIPSTTFGDDCDLMVLTDAYGNDLNSGCIFGGAGFIETSEIPADGDYILLINPSGLGVGTLDIAVTSATRTDGTIEVNGEPVTADIPKPGDLTVLTFYGTQDQQVSVTLSGSTLPDQCAVLTILDPEGNELSSECMYGGEAAMPDLTLPADGDYSIVIDPEGTTVGSAEVAVTG